MKMGQSLKIECKAEINGPEEIVDQIKEQIDGLFPHGPIEYTDFAKHESLEQKKEQIDQILSNMGLNRVRGWDADHKNVGFQEDGSYILDLEPTIERAEFKDRRNHDKESIKLKFWHNIFLG